MTGPVHSEELFPVRREYDRCIRTLRRCGIVSLLPGAGIDGIVGIDGCEYPMPSLEEVEALFIRNHALVRQKVAQGFDRLELTPMAMPVSALMATVSREIASHAAEGLLFKTRSSSSDPLVPVTAGDQKQVWIWETLRLSFDTNGMVYFPEIYSRKHHGQAKREVIANSDICAIPGWSVALVESRPFLPQPGEGAVITGRHQPEIGLSPREYLQMMRAPAYAGETGRTLEDYAIMFLSRLEEHNEISNDRYDGNALWLSGQYLEFVHQLRSDLIPTAWWNSDFGRLRLDCHRPGNKLCTKSWGIATSVRLKR